MAAFRDGSGQGPRHLRRTCRNPCRKRVVESLCWLAPARGAEALAPSGLCAAQFVPGDIKFSSIILRPRWFSSVATTVCLSVTDSALLCVSSMLPISSAEAPTCRSNQHPAAVSVSPPPVPSIRRRPAPAPTYILAFSFRTARACCRRFTARAVEYRPTRHTMKTSPSRQCLPSSS